MLQEEKEIYEFGQFRLDVAEHTFTHADGVKNGQLPEKAFQTLCVLVRNHGHLLTKRELLDQVWPDSFVEENNLDKCIHTIRHALDEKPGQQKYIETVRKHGYRFVADVKKTKNGSDVKAAATRSPAYDLYVRGKVKVGSENREDTHAAIKILEEAVAIDPNFAEAFAILARAYNTMAFKFSSGSERKLFHENAEVAIEKALALNPDLAEGHFARGLLLWTNTKRFPHEQAIQSYKRALALDPNSDEIHHQLSMVYSHIGLLEEAGQSVKNALEINPNNTMARFRAGVYMAYRGKFEDAIAIFNTIPREVSPVLVDRSTAEVLIQTGRLNEADAIVEDYLSQYPQDDGGSLTSVKALLLAKAGKAVEAKKAIDQAVQIGQGFGHFHHTAYNVASAYTALNMPENAVEWLKHAAENGFPNYPYFKIDPNLNDLRRHPQFIDFMVKLKPQWERFKGLL